MTKNSRKFDYHYLIGILGIALIGIAFMFKEVNVIRLLLVIVGVMLLSYLTCYILKVKNYVLFAVIYIVMAMLLDGIVVYTFKRIPVFSYNIISNGKVRVYNSIGVRVWQCDTSNYDNLIVDAFYAGGYACSVDDIDLVDINSFLNSIKENYNDYKNRYVKVKGRISKKNGQTSIEMAPYNTTSLTVNGYVEFADNITLNVIMMNPDAALDDYDVYDEITVIGVIKKMETVNGNSVIYMYESKIYSNVDLSSFELNVTTIENCDKEKNIILENDQYKIYTYCIGDATLSFADKNYELSMALSSNKVKLSDLIKDNKGVLSNADDDSKIYSFDNYRILVCDEVLSDDVIIGPNTLNFDTVSCDPSK